MGFFSDFSSSSCFGTYFFCFRTPFSCFRISFHVLECPFPVSERHFSVLERPFSVLEHLFPVFWGGDFVPGRPGTEEFVSGHLLLPLSRDKGTPRQEIFVCLGKTGRPLSRGNPNLNRSMWFRHPCSTSVRRLQKSLPA